MGVVSIKTNNIFPLFFLKFIFGRRFASKLNVGVNISVFVDCSTANKRPRRVKWELFTAINLCGFVSDAVTESRQLAAVRPVRVHRLQFVLVCLLVSLYWEYIGSYTKQTLGVIEVAPAFFISHLVLLLLLLPPPALSFLQLMSRFPCFSG